MTKIKVGIVGSAGYTGGELIRLLINHPNAEIVFAHSKSNTHKKLYSVHTDLLGETELVFSDTLSDNVDVLFMCAGHGESKKFLTENKIAAHMKLIDLSNDHRYSGGFTYGLPELNRDVIKTTSKLANPGCFATAIQLALLPLAKSNLLTADVHVNATTGSTGAGQALTETSHFSWRNNNLSVYKAFEHQHLSEITQSVKQFQPAFAAAINFIPQRGNFARGILATTYTYCTLSLDDARKMYEAYYADHAFVHLSEKNIDLKQVVNTNKCLLYISKHGNNLMVTSAIDNLLKGASGQAVQNMNLMFGMPETTGLKLKAIGF
jgi:N-acetyl-gamma-glutamyl-phosphate reductase